MTGPFPTPLEPERRPCQNRDQSDRDVRVPVTLDHRTASAVLMEAVFVEADDGGLDCEAFRLYVRALDGLNEMHALDGIRRLQHHLIRSDVEVAMEQRHTKA